MKKLEFENRFVNSSSSSTINEENIDNKNDVECQIIQKLHTTLTPPVKNEYKGSLFGSFRLCLVLMLMLNLYSTTSVRMNLGMAMVCMVNATAVTVKSNLKGNYKN